MSKQLPFFLTAPCEFKPVEDGEARTFSGTAYSGGLVTDWYYPVVIDLATTKLAPKMPLLFAHERNKNIGVITTAEVEASIVVGGKVFSDIDDTAKEVVAKSERGAQYQMSVGIFRTKTQFYEADEEVEVNGQKFSGPVAVMRNGLVREVSILPLGADDETNAQFFSALPTPKSETTGDENMPTIEELKGQVESLAAQVTQLNADLTAANERASVAEQALADSKTAARKAQVESLFKITGQEVTDESIAPFMEMTDIAFAATDKALREVAQKKLPEELFRDVADGEPTGGKPKEAKKASLSVVNIYEQRRIK